MFIMVNVFVLCAWSGQLFSDGTNDCLSYYYYWILTYIVHGLDITKIAFDTQPSLVHL